MGLVARQMENLYIMFKAIHVIIFDDTPLNVTSRNSDQTRDRFAFFVPNLIYIRKDEKIRQVKVAVRYSKCGLIALRGANIFGKLYKCFYDYARKVSKWTDQSLANKFTISNLWILSEFGLSPHDIRQFTRALFNIEFRHIKMLPAIGYIEIHGRTREFYYT